MKKNQLALALIFCLFFLWAISSNLLPTRIRQLMKTCELNTFEASFTESAYWLAYFIFPIPISGTAQSRLKKSLMLPSSSFTARFSWFYLQRTSQIHPHLWFLFQP